MRIAAIVALLLTACASNAQTPEAACEIVQLEQRAANVPFPLDRFPLRRANKLREEHYLFGSEPNALCNQFLAAREFERTMGVRIADENRCAPYDADDYPYPQSVELDIIDGLGACAAERFRTPKVGKLEQISARSAEKLLPRPIFAHEIAVKWSCVPREFSTAQTPRILPEGVVGAR